LLGQTETTSADDLTSSDDGQSVPAKTAAPSTSFITGVDAIARLAYAQAALDRKNGLNTAGFISGYRGSPIGGLDQVLWRDSARLEAANIKFQPAVNEELAATAIIGSQQVGLQGDADYDGVFAIWYGKGVGADRASDALKHANLMGSAKYGGALVVVGDDHGAISSATAHQCEQAMISWMMPVLHPAHVREFNRLGMLGLAMSRYCGAYVGFKAASETLETSCTVADDEVLANVVIPDFPLPADGVNIRWPDRQLDQENRQINVKLKAAQAFARANRIDNEIWRGPNDRIGVVTVGKAYGDTLQALQAMGIDAARAAEIGLGLYKVAMPWPLEPEGMRSFAGKLDRILVIEEKRGIVETQIKELFYDDPADRRPQIVGKHDDTGAPVIAQVGLIDSDAIADAVLATFPDLKTVAKSAEQSQHLQRMIQPSNGAPPGGRAPFFCAGCPHNISTQLPDGSRAHAGTGCHLMAAFMDRDTTSLLQMGGDGANWVGEAPFLKTDHIFQNLGDGTYVHSGSLAIRQAVAAGVNMTFKLLFNDVVAMTGGQPLESGPRPADISRQAAAEGVKKIAVVYDDRHELGAKTSYAPGTTFHQRDDIEQVQKQLRDTPGVSLMIYVQTCATELRRRRRRGIDPQPDRHVFINPHVCEGCSDCVRQSNCIALSTVDTPMGRKRRIDQTMCNKDYSCLKGFCPAFVEVTGTRLKKTNAWGLPDKTIPDPQTRLDGQAHNIIVAGIGGTGVVTIGRLIGAAAAIEGVEASVLDFTGLSQKGGDVVCHVRLARDPQHISTPKVGTGRADLAISCDLVTGAGQPVRSLISGDQGRVVANTYLQPTSAQVLNPDIDIDDELLRSDLAATVDGTADFMNATRLADTLTGNPLTANIFLLGFAFQKGGVPISLAALRQAIETRGAESADNLISFEWGRLAAHDAAHLEETVGPMVDAQTAPETLDELMARLTDHLGDYQNAAYGERFQSLVEDVAQAERRIDPTSQKLTFAVAKNYAKLLGYKDEYEVARLHMQTGFVEYLLTGFEPGARVAFHMAPEFLGRAKPDGSRPKKRRFGSWAGGAMRLLAKSKGLRGGKLDPFGGFDDRKNERQMVAIYEAAIDSVLRHLAKDTHGLAVLIAEVPDTIRGFGPVKLKSMTKARETLAKLLTELEDGASYPAAAE